MSAAARAELLLEIGCEELPAPWLAGLTAELGERFLELAGKEHLDPRSIVSHSTPRRLVLRAELLARQPDREEEVWGPALRLARDASGRWTKAAEGFARKNGVEADSLQIRAKGPADSKDEYLLFVRRTPGRAGLEILPSVIAAGLRGLSFPKRMSWDAWLEDGKGAFPFGRPIRWLVAIFDGSVVPFRIHELERGQKGRVVVESGDLSRGHRFLPRGSAGRAIRVRSFDELAAALAENGVTLRREERLAKIREGLGPVEAELPDDHGLVEEWVELVEHPTVVIGRIPAEFRSLPREVLETVLVHHQKYVPLVQGGVVTGFAAITNSDAAAAAEIVRGMERVVVARLRDAAFFYAEDMKRPLEERVADLAGVTFHQKLGSYLEKTERLVRLVDAMGAQMGLLTRAEHEAARAAARLAKADLTTLMVREFTELQGVMGGIYLRAQGCEWPNLPRAVQWHYHPVSIDPGSPPAGLLEGSDATVFGAVALADKLDTLAGYFGIGLQPSGSSDPFGLRRAAQGAVRVVLDFWHAAEAESRPSLRRLVRAAVAGYASRLPRPPEQVAREVESFLLDRLRYLLVSRGFPADEVDAALGAREPEAIEDPHEAWLRLRGLHAARSSAREDFEHLAVAFKRARNILDQGRGAPVEPELLREDAERELHAAVLRLRGSGGGYEARLRALAALRAPVDRFFDDVLVMAEDPRIRGNRLGLLEEALALFYRIADISRLGG